MHFTIIGAGAIGGTRGAHLLRVRHEVLFVDRDRTHVDAINTAGLTIEGRETFTVRATAVPPDALRDSVRDRIPDAVLLCVKAMHTAAAVDALAPLLAPDNFVVSLQNGLNEKVIAARIGAARTVGAFVNFGADYLEPGRAMYGGAAPPYPGGLKGTSSPRAPRPKEIFPTFAPPPPQTTRKNRGV